MDTTKAPPRRNFRKITIKDFQSHVHTEFELSDGFNILCGSSNVGKTAIIRAINFVMSNEVPNSEFVRWDCDNASVSIEFDDGLIVERIKGKRNDVFVHYPPNHPDKPEDKDYYAAINFGTVYPPKVLKALGYPPETKRLGPLWYAEQHALPFLVSQKPVDLPRAISEITDLSNLEEAAKRLSTKSKQSNSLAKEAQKQAEKVEEELLKYDNLDWQLTEHARIERSLDSIELRYQKVARAQTCYDTFIAVSEEIQRVEEELEDCEAILDSTQNVQALHTRMKSLLKAKSLLDQIEDSEREYEDTVSSLDLLKQVLDKVPEERIAIINQRLDRLKRARELYASYTDINAQGYQTKLERDAAQVELVAATNALEEFKKRMTDEGKLCKACGQVVSI